MFSYLLSLFRWLWWESPEPRMELNSLPEEMLMELNSLPEEMLTNVLKYTNFEKGREMRKINQRIDKMARRNDLLRRIPVKSIGINCNNVIIHYREIEDDLSFDHPEPRREHELSTILDRWLPRVQIIGDLHIERMELNQSCIEVFKKHKRGLRKISKIHLSMDNLFASQSEPIAMIRELFPAIEDLSIFDILHYRTKLRMNSFVAEISETRKLKQLTITTDHTSIDNNFFFKIAPNCKKMNIWLGSPAFTVADVMEMLEKCTTALKLPLEISFVTAKIDIADMKRALKTKFPFVEMKIDQDNRIELMFSPHH